MNVKDLKIEYYKSGGPGGQHKNKRFMAVRVTHIPTGISAVGQEERSQGANKLRAFERLREKLALRSKQRKQRIATRPSRASKERKIADKKAHSFKKKLRGKDFSGDF